MYLPRVDAARESLVVSSISLPRGGNEIILLAEDESGIRAMTRAYLESLGYRVIEAADGSEAIARSLEYGGTISLVLSDLLMPRMRGDTAVNVIRTHRPGIKALFISGYADQDAKDLDILYKPFEFPELGRRVRSALDGGSATALQRVDPAAD